MLECDLDLAALRGVILSVGLRRLNLPGNQLSLIESSATCFQDLPCRLEQLILPNISYPFSEKIRSAFCEALPPSLHRLHANGWILERCPREAPPTPTIAWDQRGQSVELAMVMA